MTPEQNRIRGQLGATLRHRPDDVAAITELRRDLRASRLADHIKQVVNGAPPLTTEQRDRLAVLLRGGDAA